MPLLSYQGLLLGQGEQQSGKTHKSTWASPGVGLNCAQARRQPSMHRKWGGGFGAQRVRAVGHCRSVQTVEPGHLVPWYSQRLWVLPNKEPLGCQDCILLLFYKGLLLGQGEERSGKAHKSTWACQGVAPHKPGANPACTGNGAAVSEHRHWG